MTHPFPAITSPPQDYNKQQFEIILGQIQRALNNLPPHPFNVDRGNAEDKYTLGTHSTDRTVPDSASVTLQQLADIVSTLIQDLKTAGYVQ